MPSTVKIKTQQSHWLVICTDFLILLISSSLRVSYCSPNNDLRIDARIVPSLGRPYEAGCNLSNNSIAEDMWWSREDTKLTDGVEKKDKQVVLKFTSLNLSHISNYTCNAKLKTGELLNVTFFLGFDVPPKIQPLDPVIVRKGENRSVICSVTGYPLSEGISWTYGDDRPAVPPFVQIFSDDSGLTFRNSTLHIIFASDANNGTYHCQFAKQSTSVHVKVLGEPTIKFHVIKALSKSSIFVNWTLNDGNSPLKDLTLSYKEEEGVHEVALVAGTNRHIIKGLKAGTRHTDFNIIATNDIGIGNDFRGDNITTLTNDTNFTPTVVVVGSTSDSVTMNVFDFQRVAEFYHFFNITIISQDGSSVISRIERGNPFLVTSLQPGKTYTFQVQACSDYTEICGERSTAITHQTMDGKASPPQNVTIWCKFDDKAGEGTIVASWQQPMNPRGTIETYSITLKREADYVNRNGEDSKENSTVTKTVNANTHSLTFAGESPNTNFSVSVCAKTKLKTCGEIAESPSCGTPATPPDIEELSKASWSPVLPSSTKRVYFLVNVPQISQRNGSICCFRIVVIKLQKGQDLRDLNWPNQLELRTYEEVHNSSESGAYVAEMINSNRIYAHPSQKSLKIGIGDEEYNKDDKRSACHHCWPSHDVVGATGSYRRPITFSNSTSSDAKAHRKRHASSGQSYVGNPPVRDGPLDLESRYTAYLDAIIVTKDSWDVKMKTAHSRYFDVLPAKLVEKAQGNAFNAFFEPRNLAKLVVGSMGVTLMFIFMALICVMRRRRKEPGDQEYGLCHSIQQFCMCLRGQESILSIMAEQPPISKEMLVPAYQERHENGDARFQKEFSELPERFPDRTTEASTKNASKNRYPDIRAYDQTRVKLSTADGGSDYINANFVVGYKERKKFICAQGPMESTVVDWWRMVWEQRIHLLIMLTNVEEYNKTKCAKYWPSEGSNEYGSITVTHTGEKRYSDYLVRNLKLRLNGPDGDTVKEERDVEQYHYLVWKDYMAPEHPVGIIRFIKRVNDVYSLEKGPILVHCSAGVGRTGTLVALDFLLQQLNEEGCVSILNTICDLRHQRNYLVQSLKQYIFIYRALMEAALFGDTEVAVPDLKSHIEKLKATPEGKNMSRLQEEFERLSQVIEDRKPFVTGSSEENRHRNRHENVIPYDRNRVQLSPMPGLNKEICTYINASFIEGYDSSEQYIIAQDPLETTVGDFWRMIVEHNIRSVVMLSEVGDDKCPRYWPEKDQETSHDYIRVKYMQSQSFPFYYRREFTVTNTKAEDSCLVTQFQYNGWPVGETAVPESTRGMVELIDTTFKHKETLAKVHGPTLIHCSAGADRSCIFVALAILVRQMMSESRVDVFSVVRKLRSQRQGLFQSLAQYEFVYRGLDIYADLHVANGNASH